MGDGEERGGRKRGLRGNGRKVRGRGHGREKERGRDKRSSVNMGDKERGYEGRGNGRSEGEREEAKKEEEMGGINGRGNATEENEMNGGRGEQGRWKERKGVRRRRRSRGQGQQRRAGEPDRVKGMAPHLWEPVCPTARVPATHYPESRGRAIGLPRSRGVSLA